ncbi:hypothetical protein CLF_106480 [Clonorchis sinensis]|uniref:Uncharacterized protein n=1 Tax=Clonorchis sinensis TaxID=79923 RepID=G7YPY9_CLOSI|nr:hypothetical protein CLF_106480 [Clonorchis sinensis]
MKVERYVCEMRATYRAAADITPVFDNRLLIRVRGPSSPDLLVVYAKRRRPLVHLPKESSSDFRNLDLHYEAGQKPKYGPYPCTQLTKGFQLYITAESNNNDGPSPPYMSVVCQARARKTHNHPW